MAERTGSGQRPKSIELVVSGVSARVVLWEDLAPKAIAALVESLPVDAALQHCKWSGQACFAEISLAPAALESPVTSIYPGVLAIRPPDAPGARAELLIAYGDAEYRTPEGRRYVAPVGELEPGSEALLHALARTAKTGETTLRLKLATEAS